MKTLKQFIQEEEELFDVAVQELQEGPSLADMHPDNINAIIKKHGKKHAIYKDSGETVHGLGFKDLKQHLGIGTSGAVHKKFTQHLDKHGFKQPWSHTSNEWVAQLKEGVMEENFKVGAKVKADGKEGVVQSKGGDYYDVHHHDGSTGSYHVSKVKPLILEAKKEEDLDRIAAGRKYLAHANEFSRYSNAEKTSENRKKAAHHKRAMEKYRQMMDKDVG